MSHHHMPIKKKRFSEQSGDMTGLLEAVAIRRDRNAFVTLYNHFAPRVKTFLLRSGTSDARAEELAQETMLIVWRKADSFVPRNVGVAGWIFTIARNLQIDSIRREHRFVYNLDAANAGFETQEQEQRTPEDAVTAAHMEARVREALAQLSPEQVRVIELFFFSNKTHAEIEKELQIPLGTVKSRLRLALSKLRALLDHLR
jgi:RNA polymerase sigma-70 factor (ECF subfamily)